MSHGLGKSCFIEQSFEILSIILIPAPVTSAKSDKLLSCASSGILVNMKKVSGLTSLHFVMLENSVVSNSCGSNHNRGSVVIRTLQALKLPNCWKSARMKREMSAHRFHTTNLESQCSGVTLFISFYLSNMSFLVISSIFTHLRFSCNLAENCLAASLAVI